MRKALIRFIVLVCTALLPTTRSDVAEHQKDQQHMSKLAPLNGELECGGDFPSQRWERETASRNVVGFLRSVTVSGPKFGVLTVYLASK